MVPASTTIGGTEAATGGAGTAVEPALVPVPRLMTADQLADLLGMDVEWVWKMSRRGQIPTITLGRSRRYRRDAILRWLEEIEAKPSH